MPRQQPGLEETREEFWEKISPSKTEVARENDERIQKNSPEAAYQDGSFPSEIRVSPPQRKECK